MRMGIMKCAQLEEQRGEVLGCKRRQDASGDRMQGGEQIYMRNKLETKQYMKYAC